MDSVLAIGSLDVLGPSGRGGRTAAFLVLLGFVVSFLFIRMSTRMIRAQVSWWPGNIETESGLHLHHLVWGIALMTVSGFVGFALHTPSSPWYPVAAVLFGVGVGLTFDEFALWVHLKDVYWTEEGRSSLDAVVLVTAFMTLVVLGTKPFGLKGNEAPVIVPVIIVQALLLSVICFLKGRIALGGLAVFIPGLGLWGACRLGKPDSPWGRHRYSAAKRERAHARFPPDSRGRRFRDAFSTRSAANRANPCPRRRIRSGITHARVRSRACRASLGTRALALMGTALPPA